MWPAQSFGICASTPACICACAVWAQAWVNDAEARERLLLGTSDGEVGAYG